jgi:hypothetical protein
MANHEHAGHDHEHEGDAMDVCIEACLQSHVVCTLTIQHCISQGGEHASIEHLGLLQDCAEICLTSAHFMLRGSPWHELTCAACAEVCRACAESCAQFEGDEAMEQCAEACRHCADHCAEMAGGMEEDEEEEEEE